MKATEEPATHTVYLCRKVGNTFEWLECGKSRSAANGGYELMIDRLPLGDEITGDGWTGHMQVLPFGKQPKQVNPETL